MSAKKFKIKKDDIVQVIAGKDKGKRGKVLEVIKSKDKLIIEKINISLKNIKPSQTSSGGIVEKFVPIHISNVALTDPVSNKPTRVTFIKDDEGKKIRVSVRLNNVI